MTVRSCPDWPELMEVDPDLQFKHYTVAEAHLPGEALMHVPGLDLNVAEICADLEHHVFNAEHTHPDVAAALASTHWIELRDPTRPRR